jgi:hypothetical protein
MSAPVEQAARLAMAISDLSPNISVDLVLHGHGVDVTGRLVSPTAGYRTRLPVSWADLRRNPELLTTVVLSTALGLARTETRFERVAEMKPQAAKALLVDGEAYPDEGPWAARWALGGAVLTMVTIALFAVVLL